MVNNVSHFYRPAALAGMISIVCAFGAGSVCLAQQQTQTVQTVIVLDFENRTGQAANDHLARLATDGVAVELSASGKFEVLKRTEVDRTAKELNLKPPYDFLAKSKLAATLGATAIVEGSLDFVKEGVKRVDKKETRVVQVGLKVRVLEASSGDLIGGAAVIGEAAARGNQAGYREKAVNDAVRSTKGRVETHKLIEGSVVSSVGFNPRGNILINRGERNGVKVGMKFNAIWMGQKTGVLRVSITFATDSETEVIEGTPKNRYETQVREILDEPEFSTDGRVI